MRVCVCVCECVSVWNRFDPSRSENWWRRAGFSYLLAVCFPVTYGQVDGLAFSLSLSLGVSLLFSLFQLYFCLVVFFPFRRPHRRQLGQWHAAAGQTPAASKTRKKQKEQEEEQEEERETKEQPTRSSLGEITVLRFLGGQLGCPARFYGLPFADTFPSSNDFSFKVENNIWLESPLGFWLLLLIFLDLVGPRLFPFRGFYDLFIHFFGIWF